MRIKGFKEKNIEESFTGKNPDTLIQKLRKNGIQARRFYRPLHQQPLYKSKKSNFSINLSPA